MKYHTRIAPSPTGSMHLGTARTALFNYLAAKASGGTFLLRIDDTDADRNKPEHVEVIKDTMSWLGLNYDASFHQSSESRQAAYKEVLQLLLMRDIAVELDNGAIALKWHDWMPRQWVDDIAGIQSITDTFVDQIDRKLILMRGGEKLGQPTYQFCSVLDDYETNINFIIRGTDHITNTSKQVALWTALSRAFTGQTRVFDKPLPRFAHVGLIFKDKKKMSKRDDAASMLWYRDNGYDPDGLCNFMLRMGWAPREDNKANSVLPRDRAIKMFLSEGSMRNVNCGFDAAKLEYFDRTYKRMKNA